MDLYPFFCTFINTHVLLLCHNESQQKNVATVVIEVHK